MISGLASTTNPQQRQQEPGKVMRDISSDSRRLPSFSSAMDAFEFSMHQ
jgi:hypothetical protein